MSCGPASPVAGTPAPTSHRRIRSRPRRTSAARPSRRTRPSTWCALRILGRRSRRLAMPLEGDRAAPIIVTLSLGYDPGLGPVGAGGNTTLMLDQYDGHELWTGRQADLPFLRQVVETWSRPLHTGTFGHTATRLLWLALAAATLVLGVSGHFTLFLRHEIHRRRRLPWRRHVRRRRQRHLHQRELVHQRRRARRGEGRRPGAEVEVHLGDRPGGRSPDVMLEAEEVRDDALV